MIIEYEGQRYPFDFADITVKQAIRIEKFTGMPFGEWGKAAESGSSLVALQAVGWLVLTGGDLGTPVEDCDFKLAAMGDAIRKANAAENAAEEAARVAEESGPRPTSGTSTGLPSANGAGDLSSVSSGGGM